MSIPEPPVTINVGGHMSVALNGDGSATVTVSDKDGSHVTRLSAAQTETFAYELANNVGATR